MASNSIKFNIDFNTNTSGINQAKKALEQLQNLTSKDIAVFNNLGLDEAGLKKARSLLLDIMTESNKAKSAMEAAFNQKLNTVNMQKFKEELVKNGTSLEHFKQTMAQAGPIGEKAFTEMGAGIANVRYQTVQTTTVIDKMAASLQRSLTTFISINIINKVKGAINEAYGYVKNLDTSLNEIRIVTGKSADEMDRFAEKANKAAASLGKATTDYTKASTTFYQQGLSDEEVQARTDVTVKASNTTGQDTKTVANNLTALWNGFNVGAEEAEIYVDRLAALAATTASNLDELTTAMSKTASMANVMGVSEEQLAAQIATVVSVTRQAPESVGTAFKTIYSRISDISSGAEDAETTLGNYSSKLAEMGINVLDSSGKLRDMGEVIEEIGGKWSNYSKEQQVAIAGIMGGQRQVNQVTALFDNWGEYTESIKTMVDAEGTLQKQQDVYMESAEGQLQKLRTEWEGVLDSLLNADDIIKVAKTISPIFTSLEKVIDAFGGGIGILTKFSPLLFSLVSPKISEGIAKIGMSFKNTKINAEIAKSEVEGLQLKLKEKVGDSAGISEYSKQIQELIDQYGELRDSMSVEQRNQFKESLESLIENEGPKAQKELEGYAEKVKEIKALEVSTDNNILTDVINSEDQKKVEGYMEKVQSLQKVLSQPPEEIINNFESIKKQIQDTLGDNEIGKKLIHELEIATGSIKSSEVGQKIKESIEDPLKDIDMSEIEQQLKETFGEENSQEIERYKNGVEEIAKLRSQMVMNEKLLAEAEEKVKQIDQERFATKDKLKALNQQSQILQEEAINSAKKAAEIESELLQKNGVQSMSVLQQKLKLMRRWGETESQEYQDLKKDIEAWKEYNNTTQEALNKIPKIQQEYIKTAAKIPELQTKAAEAMNISQDYKNSLTEYQEKINHIYDTLSNGAISQEEANQMIEETTRAANGEVSKLENGLGGLAQEINNVSNSSAQCSSKTLSLRQSFEEVRQSSAAQTFLNIGTAAMSAWTGIKNLQELGSIWNDEDLTTGEKIEKIITTAIASLGTLIYAIKILTAEETKNAIVSVKSLVAKTAETIGTAILTKVTWKYTEAATAATAATIAGMIALGLIIAVLGVAIFGIIKAVQAWQKAHKTSVENLKEANEKLKEATDKYNELKSAIEDYKDAEKGLDELTEGTQEFMDAIIELNKKVLELIETYPELAQYLEVGQHGEMRLNNEGLKEYIELQKESLRLQSQSTIAEGLSTEEDKRVLGKQVMEALFNKGYKERGDGEAAAFEYSKLLEQQQKADKAKISSYLKSYESFKDISVNTANAIAQDLQNEYKDDIEGLKKAMADEEAMLKRAEEYEKKAKNFANKGFNFSDADIKNGDFSNISKEDVQSIFQMDRTTLADMLGVDESSREIDDFLGQVAMAWTELKNLPAPFEDWVTAGMDLGIVEKFEKDVKIIKDDILVDLGNGIKELGNKYNIDEFTTDLANIDWTKGEEGLIDFREKYKDLGEEVENYIQAQKEANVIYTQSLGKLSDLTSAMGTVSQKKFGDMLSEKDYNELVGKFEGLEKYFQKIGDKYQYVAINNKIVLEDLKKAYREESKEIIELSKTFSNIDTSKLLNINQVNSLSRVNSQSDADTMTKNNQNKTQFFNSLSENTMMSLSSQTKLTVARIKEIGEMSYEQIKSNEKALEDYETIITAVTEIEEIKKQRDKEFIAAQISSLQELDTAVKDGTVSWKAAEEEREYIRNKELQSLGVAEEAYKNYLLAIGEDISKINNTEIMIRFKMDLNGKKTFEDIDKMFADLPNIVDRTEADTAVAISNLTNTLKSNLDIDVGDFIDEENFNLFEKMIGGDEDSQQQLTKSVQDELNLLQQGIEDAEQSNDTETANILSSQKAMLKQLLIFLNIYQDEWGEAARERRRELEQELNEINKAATQQARSKTQKNISKVEDQLAHATGSKYIELARQKEALQKKELSQMKEINEIDKLQLQSMDTEITGLKEKLQIEGEITTEKLRQMLDKDPNNENLKKLVSLYKERQSLAFSIENAEQEIVDYEKEQYLTVDKTLDEKRIIAVKEKEIAKLQKEEVLLSGKALTENLEKQRKLQKEITEEKQKQLEAMKEEYREAKKALTVRISDLQKEGKISASFNLEFLDDGSIKNFEEFIDAINGTPFAEELQNMANKVNEAADSVHDFANTLLEETMALAEQFGTDYDEENRKKEIAYKKSKAERVLEKDPNNIAAQRQLQAAQQEELDLAKSARDDFVEKYDIKKKDGKLTSAYGEVAKNSAKDLGIMLITSDYGMINAEELRDQFMTELSGNLQEGDTIESVLNMSDEELSKRGISSEQIQGWKNLFTQIQKNNDVMGEFLEKNTEFQELQSQMEPGYYDKTAEKIKGLEDSIDNLNQDIANKEKEMEYTTAAEKPKIAAQLQELYDKKDATEENLKQSYSNKRKEDTKNLVKKSMGVLGYDEEKATGLYDQINNLDEVTKESLHTLFNWETLSDGQREILEPLIDTLLETTKAQKKLNDETNKYRLPYDEYAKYNAQVDVHNQKQTELNNKLKDEQLIISELQAEESLLYGDDLIANLEAQEDSIERTIALQKEQIKLSKEETRLQEQAIQNTNQKKIDAEDLLSSAVSGKIEDFKIEDYLLENGQIDEEKLSKALGELGDDERPQISDAMKAYNEAVKEGKDATQALVEAQQTLIESTNELNEKERELLQKEKQRTQQVLKNAEEAVLRETNANHKLAKALKEVEEQLEKNSRAQDGLSGPALLANMQQEITLQQQKKQILEQQYQEILKQIKALIELYNVHMMERFGVNVGFKVDETGVTNVNELYAAIDKVDSKLKGEYKETLDGFISQLNSLASSASSAADSVKDVGNTIEDLTKKMEEEQEKETFRIKDEKWYAEDEALKRIARELKNIQREQKQLTGNALIKNLTAQQQVLEKQAATQQRKLQIMKAELATMQALLAAYGAVFDAEGLITNYSSIFAQGDEKVNGYMQSYRQLYDQIMDLEDSIQDTYDQKADLEIQKTQERLRMFNAKVDVELDLGKAKREWQSFKREFMNTLRGLRELNDSILEDTKQNMRDIVDMSSREIPLLTSHMNDIMTEISLMQAGGTSSLYGTDQSTALSDLSNYRQQLQDSLGSLKSAIEAVEDSYMRQLEKIKQKFDDQLSNYETIQSIIEHDMNLIKLLKGEESYAELANYYEKSTVNYEKEIQFLRKQVDYWKNLMDNAQPGSKEWETFQSNWKDALSKLNSSVEAAIQNLLDKYDNAAKKIIKDMENELTNNTGFDYMKEKWDKDNQMADAYLDKVAKEYELQKLSYKYQKMANEADNPTTRAKILKIMQEEVDTLKQKDKLTRYDVDRAEKMYDLKMKQLELEDSANNKTQMRLRRDEEGNYRYEYIADEDKMAELKQQILDMEEEIRQFDLSNLREKQEEAMELARQYAEEMYKIEQDYEKGLINDEQREERLAYLKDYFDFMTNANADSIETTMDNLTRSTTNEMVDLGILSADVLKTMTKDAKEAITQDISPIYHTAVTDMVEKIQGEGGLAEATKVFVQDLSDLTVSYKEELENVQNAAGITFEDIINGVDENISEMYDLIDVNDDLLAKYEEELNAIESLIDQLHNLMDAYMDVYDAAMQAIDAALELRELEQDYVAPAVEKYSNNSGSTGAISSNIKLGSIKYSQSGKSSTSTTSTNQVGYGTYDGKVYKLTGQNLFAGESTTLSSGGQAYKQTATGKNTGNTYFTIFTNKEDAKNAGKIATQIDEILGNETIAGYATGGYTGEWGDNGKMAILHEKELVLNKQDTSNFLEAIKVLKGSQTTSSSSDIFTDILHSILAVTHNIYDTLMNMLDFEISAAANSISSIDRSISTTTNNINANFPNAGNMNEIKNALLNLPNYASQQMGRSSRMKNASMTNVLKI